MPYAAVNGTELHYRIDGDRHGNAPWIVLSNSLGSDLSMWTPQVAALSKHFRVLRYDTRGHGHSEAPKGPYTIDQLTGDVLGQVDELSALVEDMIELARDGEAPPDVIEDVRLDELAESAVTRMRRRAPGRRTATRPSRSTSPTRSSRPAASTRRSAPPTATTASTSTRSRTSSRR